MSDKPIPFVITDRRKFTPEGEARPDADPSPEREPRPETVVIAPTPETPGAPSQAVSSPEVGSNNLDSAPLDTAQDPDLTHALPNFRHGVQFID